MIGIGESGRAVRRAVLILVLAAAAGACSRAGPAPPPAAQKPSPPSDYLAPPELTSAVRGPDGVVALSGAGQPDGVLRLARPGGSAIGGTVAQDGAWSLGAPADPGPRLYSLSETVAGRMIRARGYIAILPPPGPAAVLLRPATAAGPVGLDHGLSIAAIDFDTSGAAVASGRASPGQAVRLQLDGVDAGEDRADDAGVFDIPLSVNLRPGPHRLTAAAAGFSAAAAFDAAPAAPIRTPPFDAVRAASAWRIDWMTPGGGVQTTLVFDPNGGRA